MDDQSGLHCLHNLIELVEVPSFPGASAPLVIFLQLYDGIGKYRLSVELHDRTSSAREVTAFLTSLDFPERFAKMDVILPVDSLRLPHSGRYEVVILLDGQELATQVFDAEVTNGEKEE